MMSNTSTMKRLWKPAIPPVLLAGLALFGAGCLGGKLQVAIPDAQAKVLAVGPIENRDSRYSPFTTQNFVDMLDFEFVRRGYDTRRVGSEQAEPETPVEETDPQKKQPATEVVPEKESEPASKEAEESAVEEAQKSESEAEAVDEAKDAEQSKQPDGEGESNEPAPQAAGEDDENLILLNEDDRPVPKRQDPAPARKSSGRELVTDLLPEHLRDVAGQSPPPDPTRRALASRRYSKPEIEEFFKDNSADYFIQGSIGRTESGDLLDNEQNVLIFLEIYGRDAVRIGLLTFLIDDESLESPDTLGQVCDEVVEAISLQVLKNQ